MGNSINRQRTGGLTAARYLYDPAGGYFDGRGRAYYYIPDYQGNNLGVVDADGHLTQRTDYYPYGEAWRQPEADINPWLYSDKELLSVDGQHEYDFGARRYTPGFPMFTTPDPLSEVRPWHSPYLFCGANPVMNTDPTGMYFTEESEQHIDTYRENIENRLKMCPGRPNFSDERLSETERVLGDMLKELTVLQYSQTAYNVTINGSMQNGDGDRIGTTSFDVNNFCVQINLYDENMDLFSHEMKHAYQFETGEISFGGMNGGPFYDQTDEMEAYERGVYWGGDEWENQKSHYPHIFSGKFGWHSSMFGCSDSDRLQDLADKFGGYFKANGRIYKPAPKINKRLNLRCAKPFLSRLSSH